LGYTFDALDIAIIAFILPVLAAQWRLAPSTVGLVAAGAGLGGVLGGLVAGSMGDAIGRRPVMMWALAVYCCANVGSALAGGWRVLLAWRVMAGFGAYAESAIVAPFLAEFAGPSFRGRYIGALAGFFSAGFVAAAVLGSLIVPSGTDGWRYVLLISAAPICMLLWWRRSLPESPRWLLSKGRYLEAEAVVVGIERECQSQEMHLGPVLNNAYVTSTPMERARAAARMRKLFSPPLIRTTYMVIVAWFAVGFSYYGFFLWVPSLLVRSGMTVATTYGFALFVYAAQIPGYLAATLLNDKVGRRPVLVISMLGGSLAAIGMLLADSSLAGLVACCALSFFMNSAFGALYAYTPELFPTEVRATASGVAAAASRIGSITAPIIVGIILPTYDTPGIFGLTAAVLLLGATAVLLLGISTNSRSLEQITGGND
jgi:putative MFS transporter